VLHKRTARIFPKRYRPSPSKEPQRYSNKSEHGKSHFRGGGVARKWLPNKCTFYFFHRERTRRSGSRMPLVGVRT
jgi:hypothetical protein